MTTERRIAAARMTRSIPYLDIRRSGDGFGTKWGDLVRRGAEGDRTTVTAYIAYQIVGAALLLSIVVPEPVETPPPERTPLWMQEKSAVTMAGSGKTG